jgi:hypothetical protein
MLTFIPAFHFSAPANRIVIPSDGKALAGKLLFCFVASELQFTRRGLPIHPTVCSLFPTLTSWFSLSPLAPFLYASIASPFMP